MGDPDELKAAIWNLIDNAIKYSSGEVQRARRARGGRRQNASRCKVSDQGVGISPVELKRIFRRFYRIPASVAIRAKGSGLGLFIVRSVAKKAWRPGVCRERAARATAAPSRCSCRGRPKRDARRRSACSSSRTSSTWPRACASTSRRKASPSRSSTPARRRSSGCSAVSDRQFDLVVLDVMLPGKDGFAVVTELRAAKQFVPVLMLTARGRPEDVLNGFRRRRRRLPAEADRAGDPAGARRRPAAPIAMAAPGRRIGTRLPAGRSTSRRLELRVGERAFPLTLMEANLLRYLVAHAGTPVSRKAMLEDVWGLREDTDTRAIDNFIVRLRRYIEQDPSQAETPADRPRRRLSVRRRAVSRADWRSGELAGAQPDFGSAISRRNLPRRRRRRRRRRRNGVSPRASAAHRRPVVAGATLPAP